MAHRKVDAPPVRDNGPVKTKPGDFEPLPSTKEITPVDPPVGGQNPDSGTSFTPCSSENSTRR